MVREHSFFLNCHLKKNFFIKKKSIWWMGRVRWLGFFCFVLFFSFVLWGHLDLFLPGAMSRRLLLCESERFLLVEPSAVLVITVTPLPLLLMTED